jgi:general secretion pathway protein K
VTRRGLSTEGRQSRAGRLVEDANGFVLVSVIWAMVLVAGLSAVFVNVLGMHLRANAGYIKAAQAEAAADGAIRLIGWRLAFAADEAAPRDGTWFRCALFEAVEARISVQDQDGIVDVNAAPLPLVAAVFEAAGAADAFADFAAYRARAAPAPGAYPAMPGSVLHAAEELFGILKIEAGEVEKLLPWLTVYSRSDGIDPAVAPPALLAALDVTPELLRPSRGRFFAITADVGEAGRGRRARRAVIELLRQPERPYAVWEWRTVSAPAALFPAAPTRSEGGADAIAAGQATIAPPCSGAPE